MHYLISKKRVSIFFLLNTFSLVRLFLKLHTNPKVKIKFIPFKNYISTRPSGKIKKIK